MKIVKTFCGRLLANYELVFLSVGHREDGYFAVIEGEETNWRAGPFATFGEAEERLKEHIAGLGMNTDLSRSVIACMDAGHRTDDGIVVGFSRDQLAEIFAKAKAAAESFKDTHDGNCNVGTPAFKVDGVPETLVTGAAEQAGVSVTPFKRDGERWYWLHVAKGQAMVEAAVKALKNAGLTAAMH